MSAAPPILGRMTRWTPTDPLWAPPGVYAVRDLFWLAQDAHDRAPTRWNWGVLASMIWLRGGRPAPITGRVGDPTRHTAGVEMWSAHAAGSLRLAPQPPLESLSRSTAVPYLPPQPTHPDTATAVYVTLGWAIGMRPAAPSPLPVRQQDGSLATADQMVEEALRHHPHATPEQRVEALRDAETVVAWSARLAARIDGIRSTLIAS
jgi:hypothetical protein